MKRVFDKLSEKEIDPIVKKCIDRLEDPEAEYLIPILKQMLMNGSIPAELLKKLPIDTSKSKKTKFDQLYDAAMYVTFTTCSELDRKEKLWKVLYPDRFGIPNVIIRADSYQEAFSLACDYACRTSLITNGSIPSDLTIKITHISHSCIKRIRTDENNRWICIRRCNIRPGMLAGASNYAYELPGYNMMKIVRKVEMKDIRTIDYDSNNKGKIYISNIDCELLYDDGLNINNETKLKNSKNRSKLKIKRRKLIYKYCNNFNDKNYGNQFKSRFISKNSIEEIKSNDDDQKDELDPVSSIIDNIFGNKTTIPTVYNCTKQIRDKNDNYDIENENDDDDDEDSESEDD